MSWYMDWIIRKWLRLSFIPPAWGGRMSWSWAGHGNISSSPWRSWKTLHWGDTALALWLFSELADCHYFFHLPLLLLSHFYSAFLWHVSMALTTPLLLACYANCITHFFCLQSNHFFMWLSLDCHEDEGNRLLKSFSIISCECFISQNTLIFINNEQCSENLKSFESSRLKIL